MKRRLALIAVALTLALVGTSMVFAYVNRADARAVAGLQPVKAYVAVKTVVSGTSLQQAVDRQLVEQQTFSRKTVPAGAVTDLSPALRHRVATSDISAGTLLLADAFASKAVQQTGLALPPGTMAVTVALQDPQRVADFVHPGSKIAVFDTFNTVLQYDKDGSLFAGDKKSVAGDSMSGNHFNNHATKLLLSDVDVVAIGSTTAATRPASGAAAASPKTTQIHAVLITVAVRLHDAEKLILAAQTGNLYLALLPPDASATPDGGVDGTNLFD